MKLLLPLLLAVNAGSLTLDEKIGQMLMAVGIPSGGFRAADSDEMKDVRREITEFHAGSVHVEEGDAAATALMLNELQHLAKIPLLTAHNLEGGAGYVISGATRLPMAMVIGATGDERLAYEAARVTAQEGRAIGINVNFYPVADVNNNPANPIINIRSFGEDPATVSRFVAAYVRGLQDNGQIATAKHFPGHGDVAVDSHLEMPVLDVSPQRLQSVELPPFRAAIEAGAGAVMTAHIWLPKLESEKGLPATLSKHLLTDVLRGDLHFAGIVFTDAMRMRGVSLAFSNGEAAVRAIEAGADILVGSPSVADSFHAIQAAVRSGRIPESRLDQSVRRILAAKAKLGLDKPANRYVDVNTLMQKVGIAEHRALAQRIADKAITLVKDEAHVLPLRPSPDTRIVQINFMGGSTQSGLSGRFPRTTTIDIDDRTAPGEYDMVRKLAGLADVIVVNAFARPPAALVRDLIAMNKPLVYIAFGNPYVLSQFPELPVCVATYDIDPTAELAAVKAITGEIPFQGHLPVTLVVGSTK